MYSLRACFGIPFCFCGLLKASLFCPALFGTPSAKTTSRHRLVGIVVVADVVVDVVVATKYPNWVHYRYW